MEGVTAYQQKSQDQHSVKGHKTVFLLCQAPDGNTRKPQTQQPLGISGKWDFRAKVQILLLLLALQVELRADAGGFTTAPAFPYRHRMVPGQAQRYQQEQREV